MRRDDARHGTYAGFQVHRKEGKRPCGACRDAYNTYQRGFRNQGDYKQQERRLNSARSKALWRLAARHRTEFRDLVNQVLAEDAA